MLESINDEEFTEEELEILGEETEPEESEGEESEETGTGESEEESTETEDEDAEEDEQPEGEPDEELELDDGAREFIEDDDPKGVQKRINKLYAESKSAKEKLDLLKTDPDRYYEQYPDERPEAETEARVPSFKEAAGMRVQGGEYDGMTLEEVWGHDQIEAFSIYENYKDSVRQAETEKAQERDAQVEQSNQEIRDFSAMLSHEIYEKPVNDLSDDEVLEVSKRVSGVIDFMAETGRGSGILKDAYFLMNQDGLLKDAEKKGAKSLAKKISGSNSVPSVKTGTAGGGGGNIYDDALALTPSEMAGRLDNMTEGQMKDFINKAPAKVKAKFPGIDWDPL